MQPLPKFVALKFLPCRESHRIFDVEKSLIVNLAVELYALHLLQCRYAPKILDNISFLCSNNLVQIKFHARLNLIDSLLVFCENHYANELHEQHV